MKLLHPFFAIVFVALCLPAQAEDEKAPTRKDIATAIAKGDVEDVKRHVAADPSCLNPADPKTRSPLDLAILRNQTEIALVLIDLKADPNRIDSSKRTPLHWAVTRNNDKIILPLIKAGAKPNELDKTGWTPLHHAAAKNQIKTTKALLKGGADPMTLSELGGTPLHEAATGGSAELIEVLLAAGVDPSIKSKQDVTAFDLAKEYKNQAAIDALSK
ncbi:ankyrin repeat domain-containing protein [Haloferula sp.]|uniref:ankyrin repeat domain-containing protein n=1 Tax=Haloferula sp. TaxID=2497595 RepID=UPI003C733049